MKEERTIFLIERIPGFDMRLRLSVHCDNPVDLIMMIQGAMTIEPGLVPLFQAAIDTLNTFQERRRSLRIFTGKHQQ